MGVVVIVDNHVFSDSSRLMLVLYATSRKYSDGNSIPNLNYFLLKLDSQGNKLWAKKLDLGQSFAAFTHASLGVYNDFIVFVGSFENYRFLVKFSEDGEMIWQVTYLETFGLDDEEPSRLKFFDLFVGQNYIVTLSKLGENSTETLISKFDGNGIMGWQKYLKFDNTNYKSSKQTIVVKDNRIQYFGTFLEWVKDEREIQKSNSRSVEEDPEERFVDLPYMYHFEFDLHSGEKKGYGKMFSLDKDLQDSEGSLSAKLSRDGKYYYFLVGNSVFKMSLNSHLLWCKSVGHISTGEVETGVGNDRKYWVFNRWSNFDEYDEENEGLVIIGGEAYLPKMSHLQLIALVSVDPNYVSSHGKGDLILVKIDKNGKLIWKTKGFSHNLTDYAFFGMSVSDTNSGFSFDFLKIMRPELTKDSFLIPRFYEYGFLNVDQNGRNKGLFEDDHVSFTPQRCNIWRYDKDDFHDLIKVTDIDASKRKSTLLYFENGDYYFDSGKIIMKRMWKIGGVFGFNYKKWITPVGAILFILVFVFFVQVTSFVKFWRMKL